MLKLVNVPIGIFLKTEDCEGVGTFYIPVNVVYTTAGKYTSHAYMCRHTHKQSHSHSQTLNSEMPNLPFITSTHI